MATKIKIEVYQEQGNETLTEFVETINDIKVNVDQIDKALYSELISNKDLIKKAVLALNKVDNNELLIIPNAAYNFIRITKINDTDISSFVNKIKEDNFENVDLKLFNSFHGSDISDYEGYCESVENFCQDTLTSVEYLLGC